MTSNTLEFDPINPTKQQQADMVSGFLAAHSRLEKPAITSIAWDHGYRAGRGDVTGNVDEDMRILAKRQIAKSRVE